MTYNHFNKPETIYFDDDNKRISYSYDAAGNKVQELISLNGTVNRTDYVGNFVYRNDSLRYALTGQGRTVWEPGVDPKEEFFVKDHLGNVRSVIDVYTYPIIELMATYEIASANLETMVFDKVDEIRVEKPGEGGSEDHMAGRLNATEEQYRVGTSVLMKVMAGDRVEMSVDNYYDGYNEEWDEVLNPEELMDNILTTLTVGNGGFEGSESHQTDLVEQLFNPDNFLEAVDIMQADIDENKPKAFLNYILFNEDMEVVGDFTGSFQVDGEGTWTTIGTPAPMEIPENGYLAVYVSTQTQIECVGCDASKSDIYFDYFTLRFTRGNLKEETHYYPFGLPMATSAAAGFMPNRHRYQSNEYRKEGGLNWMDFHARQYDPQIGRFLGVDPLADAGGQQVFSPYAAMGNNPVAMTDPGGMMHDVFKDAWILQFIIKPPMMFYPSTLDFLRNGGNGGIPQDFLDWLAGGNEQKVESFSDEEIVGIYSFFSGNSNSDIFTKNFGAGGGGGSSKSDKGGGEPQGKGDDENGSGDGNPENEGEFGTYTVWDRAGGYDRRLSKDEADLWYLWGGGKPVYVDNSRIDWSGLTIPKGKKAGDRFAISTHEAFLYLPYETAATYGGTFFRVKDANTVEVLDQQYHYRYRANNSVGNMIRNVMTWWGAPSYIPQGQSYMIHFYNREIQVK